MFKNFFKKEGDDFAEKLVKIIKNENIEISDRYNSTFKTFYICSVDGKEYRFIHSKPLESYIHIDSKISIQISNRHFKTIKNILKLQKREKEKLERKNTIESLPDLSDVGRAAKKYNL